MIARLRLLARDQRGSAAVEFGLLAPTFMVMLIGVFQVGVGMQSYNSLRSASADTAREVSVQYQTDNRLTESQIAQVAEATATTAPYLLTGDRLTVNVQQAATQQIPNARELTLRLRYRVPTFLDFIGIDGPELDYSRPIFVTKT
jgi:Flp pilus assembly protein TadG